MQVLGLHWRLLIEESARLRSYLRRLDSVISPRFRMRAWLSTPRVSLVLAFDAICSTASAGRCDEVES